METDILYSTAISQEKAWSNKTTTLPCAQKICDGQISTLPEGPDSKH
jgi:hypothetical protein